MMAAAVISVRRQFPATQEMKAASGGAAAALFLRLYELIAGDTFIFLLFAFNTKLLQSKEARRRRRRRRRRPGDI